MQSSTPQILFEDNDIIAINKVAGTAVIPGRGIDTGTTLVELLSEQIGSKLFVVHRLDRDTSGVLLFAKNAAAHKTLNGQFEKRLIKKMYLALVQGIAPESGVINNPIKEFGSGRMGVHPDGKSSITHYTTSRTFTAASLLHISPETGRRHQIRVHCYSIGHPVMGDTVYGKDRPVGNVSRLMLHAHSIRFTHPVTTKEVSLIAQTDDVWNSIIESLE